jgi:hypothetical protein
LERGEMKLHDFYAAFGEQLSHPSNKEHYREYMKKQGKGECEERDLNAWCSLRELNFSTRCSIHSGHKGGWKRALSKHDARDIGCG